jgi:hypothetical protein
MIAPKKFEDSLWEASLEVILDYGLTLDQLSSLRSKLNSEALEEKLFGFEVYTGLIETAVCLKKGTLSKWQENI